MSQTRLLTLVEVAEYLQLPPASLHRQRGVGAKPGALGFRVGRHVRFRRADLEAWIDAQMAEPLETGR
jgi:predicted DNA-binding transcriptional regulator AlpA